MKSRAEPIAPSFEPHSGWYRGGHWAPTSETDKIEMAKAAWPCSVVILRRHGRRIPAEALLDVQHPIGHLVCQQRGDHWHADLYANPRSGDQVYVGGHELSLGFVTLERESGGTRLYRGGVWEGRKLVAQSWLCSPDRYRLHEILQDMARREADAA